MNHTRPRRPRPPRPHLRPVQQYSTNRRGKKGEIQYRTVQKEQYTVYSNSYKAQSASIRIIDYRHSTNDAKHAFFMCQFVTLRPFFIIRGPLSYHLHPPSSSFIHPLACLLYSPAATHTQPRTSVYNLELREIGLRSA